MLCLFYKHTRDRSVGQLTASIELFMFMQIFLSLYPFLASCFSLWLTCGWICSCWRVLYVPVVTWVSVVMDILVKGLAIVITCPLVERGVWWPCRCLLDALLPLEEFSPRRILSSRASCCREGPSFRGHSSWTWFCFL